MRVFTASNTNDMMERVYSALINTGTFANSRNGQVLKFNSPCAFIYTKPWKRVNLCSLRDCNPFFHMMEGLLILAGHNCVECMSKYTSQMRQYSDDGEQFNAFYGTRMHRDNQFFKTIELLKKDPNTRQAVISLWDTGDLTKKTKDKACNMMMVFNVRAGEVDMVLFNRSNDLIFGGVSGANIVHFSMIHEAVARAAGYNQGLFTHVVCDAHAYVDNPHYENMGKFSSCDYTSPTVPLFNSANEFFVELGMLIDCVHRGEVINDDYNQPFLKSVAVPMLKVWESRDTALLVEIKDVAWRAACKKWLSKRGAV